MRPEFAGMLIFFFSVATLISVTTLLRAWLQRPRRNNALERDLDERLARIEHAVEAAAIEVERIGESQRFLTRTLAERPTHLPVPPSSAERITTPH